MSNSYKSPDKRLMTSYVAIPLARDMLKAAHGAYWHLCSKVAVATSPEEEASCSLHLLALTFDLVSSHLVIGH